MNRYFLSRLQQDGIIHLNESFISTLRSSQHLNIHLNESFNESIIHLNGHSFALSTLFFAMHAFDKELILLTKSDAFDKELMRHRALGN